MSRTQEAREVDGKDDTSMAAQIIDDMLAVEPEFIIRITANPNWYPSMCSYFTPAQAREFAAFLTELADEADLLNLEDGSHA